MPSPLFPRSLSDLGTTLSHQSRSQSRPRPHIVPSSQSALSDTAAGTAWPKKLGDLLALKTDSSTKSDLTEKSLEVFNRRNEKFNAVSPYYKGLIDYSLDIQRQRYFDTSPGKDSDADTSISSSSKSSLVARMQEWSSVFFYTKRSHDTFATSSSSSSSSSTRRRPAKIISGSVRTTTIPKDPDLEIKDVSSSVKEKGTMALLNNKEKPLRERVSKPQSTRTPAPSSSLLPLPTQQGLQLAVTTAKETAPTQTQSLPEQTVALNEKTKSEAGDRVFVWADKYRPTALKDFICNRNTARELKTLVCGPNEDPLNMEKEEDCHHFIFEGPPGVGKKTMIWALLSEIFGAEKVQAREGHKKFDLKEEGVGSIDVNIKESPKHVELNLSELKGYEKHVIVQLIKQKNDRLFNKNPGCNRDNSRAIVLCETDKLSTDALLYVRWLLERYKGCYIIFFCCSDLSKLQPIKSLCTVYQLLPPSVEEIVEVLEFIAKQEGIILPHTVAVKIATNSKNNLRQAIRSFEATWQSNPSLEEDQEIMTGWEDDIANIAKNIIEEQSPKQLYIIRAKLQNLIEHNVSPEFIFKTLKVELKKHFNEELQLRIDHLYQEYNRDDGCDKQFICNRHDQRNKRSQDPARKNVQQFMKIEEFIAKFMSWYKGYSMSNRGT